MKILCWEIRQWETRVLDGKKGNEDVCDLIPFSAHTWQKTISEPIQFHVLQYFYRFRP